MRALIGGVLLLTGCASHKSLGMVDGRRVYRVECPRSASCNDEAIDACGGAYETVGADEEFDSIVVQRFGPMMVAKAQRQGVLYVVCYPQNPED